MKNVAFVAHGVSHEMDDKPHLKFHKKKAVLFAYRTMPRQKEFWWMNDRLWSHWNQSLFLGLV
jgi:hypothetical protein